MTQSPIAVAWFTKAAGALVGLCSVGSFVLSFSVRIPDVPLLSLAQQLNAALHIGLLAAIGHGVLWSLWELVAHKQEFSAGGHGRLPQGLSAVILSLSLTLPIVSVPAVYGWVMRLPILRPAHWYAAPFFIFLGATAHIVMYGAGPNSFAGLRRRFMPPTERRTPLRIAILMECLYSVVYFTLMVLPYRIIVEAPTPSLTNTVVARTILPGFAFVASMTVLILLRPATLRNRAGIEMRGILGGIFLVCYLCAGMFV